jgi:hypothetical protein
MHANGVHTFENGEYYELFNGKMLEGVSADLKEHQRIFEASIDGCATISNNKDIMPDGSDWGPWTYTGQGSKGLRHGSGMCTWHKTPFKGACTYNGEWKLGVMSGANGWLSYQSGFSYTGYFEDGEIRRGTANYPHKSGLHVGEYESYLGEFSKWKLHGRGKYIDFTGRTEHDGLWECGKPVKKVAPSPEVGKCSVS